MYVPHYSNTFLLNYSYVRGGSLEYRPLHRRSRTVGTRLPLSLYDALKA